MESEEETLWATLRKMKKQKSSATRLINLYYLSRFTFRSVFYSLFFYRTLGKLEKKDGRLELRGNSRVVNGTPTPIRRHKTPEEAILQGQKQASGRSKAKAVSEVKKLSVSRCFLKETRKVL